MQLTTRCLPALLALACVHPAVTADTRPPEPVRQAAPQYPQRALHLMHEGWVLTSFVVTADGRVRDALVEDSSSRDFEQAALQAVGQFRFEPALRDGVPVDSGTQRFRITFELADTARSIRPDFRSRIASIQTLIADGDLTAAERALDRLERRHSRNVYEDAYLWWARAIHHDLAGTRRQRHQSLRRALGWGYEDRSLLPPELKAAAMELLYHDFVEYGQLAEAILAWERMSAQEETGELATRLADHVAGLREIASGGDVVRVLGELPDGHPWHHTLMRRSFEFHEVHGTLARLDLRCDHGARSLEVQPDAAWSVPRDWGTCWLYVHGNAGTRFELFEYDD